MPVTRRTLLALTAAAPALARPAFAATGAPPPAASQAQDLPALMSERSFGQKDAKQTVTEFFSLTCTHCARFSNEVMPAISERLVKTGKVRFVYWDFPLDQVALIAAMVARALPAERYEPFISTLFATQDRWAFDRQADPIEQLSKMAMLAGMSRETFDATVHDKALRDAILKRQQEASVKYNIQATPTFLCGDKLHSGEMDFGGFTQFLASATG